MKIKSQKNLIIGMFFVFAIIFALMGYSSGMFQVEKGISATIYKSMYCGCCEGYVEKLKDAGFNVKIKNVNNVDTIKIANNIPTDMGSCHTVIIGDYFIEGHVPIEAINKLLTEMPNIDGIALPGMPSGTPGMPGEKTEDWVIYSIKDGVVSEFMIV